TPHHHGQYAVLSASLTARHRRVEKVKATVLGRREEFSGDIGRGRGVVDEHRTLAHGLERPLGTQRDVAHIAVVADATEHEVLVLGGFRGCRRGPTAVLLHPGFCLGGVAVVDREVVPALLGQMSCHWIAHDTQADPRHLRHIALPHPKARDPDYYRMPRPLSGGSFPPLPGRSPCLTAARLALPGRRTRLHGGACPVGA